MFLPLISVVTPSLNQARFIEANITSVLRQEYRRVEHLVVDGGSTDGTIDLLKGYSHLRLTSERDRGQSDALNKGFRNATGDIVGWLNADDTYCDGTFARVVREFEDPAVMVVHGDGLETDATGAVLRALPGGVASPDGIIPYWKWMYAFVQPSFFFRRGVFDAVGYLDESLHYAMDYDFIIRCGLKYPFRYINVPLATLRLHAQSKTGMEVHSPVPAYIREMQRVSFRYWGGPGSARFYTYGTSFLAAVAGSAVRNLLMLPGSKSRMAIEQRRTR